MKNSKKWIAGVVVVVLVVAALVFSNTGLFKGSMKGLKKGEKSLKVPVDCKVASEIVKAMDEKKTWDLSVAGKAYRVTVERIYINPGDNKTIVQVLINGDRLAELPVGVARNFSGFGDRVGNDGTFIVFYSETGPRPFIAFKITEKVANACVQTNSVNSLLFLGRRNTVFTINEQYDVTVERIYKEGNGVATGDTMRVDLLINGDRLVGLRWEEVHSFFGEVNHKDSGSVRVDFISMQADREFVVFTIKEK